MSITIVWDNDDKTILRYDFSEEWKWSDVETVTQISLSFLDTVTESVSIIINLDKNNRTPSGGLTYAKELFAPSHTNYSGNAVVIGDDKVLQTLVSILTKAYPNTMEQITIRFVDTLDDARTILNPYETPNPD